MAPLSNLPNLPNPAGSVRDASAIALRMLGFTLIEILAVVAIICLLALLGLPALSNAIDQARTARAIGDIRSIQVDLMALETGNQPLPPTLAAIGRGGMSDPWGRPYVYNPFAPGRRVPAGARRDRFLVPINSTFDLYSRGKDGLSVPPLNAGRSLDDIIRANDGGFIGLAAKF